MSEPTSTSKAELIYWLVVIVVAYLINMMIFFYGAKRQQGFTSCVNNQKSFATSIQIYAQDHQDELPPAATCWGDIRIDRDSLQCGKARRKPNGYGFNNALGSMGYADIATVDKVILTADSDNPANLLYSREDIAPRHNKRFIASFLDGHVDDFTDPFDPNFIISVVKKAKPK